MTQAGGNSEPEVGSLAEEAARLMGVAASIERMSVDAVKMRARRPKYCALSNEKLRQAGISMPSWQAALARYIERPALS